MSPVRLAWAALTRRRVETVAAALAIGLFVAYLAAVGSFVTATRADLAVRAAERVPVDWQVQVTPGGDPAAVDAAIRTQPGVADTRPVDYARVPGLVSTRPDGTTRTTGTAVVVGLPADYAAFAPRELRAVAGSGDGVALQQQTAANLALEVGGEFHIEGGPTLPVGGIVDFPAADSFFQVVGAPAGAGANAPPDNVVVVPADRFSDVVGARSVVHQVHVRFDHRALPADPAAAAASMSQRANNLAVRVGGDALVGDNLGAALSAAREDAIYAGLLVLLLGAPGVTLAGVIAVLVVALRGERRRRELALLRLRGATPARAAVLVGAPALVEAILGAGLGVAGAYAAVRAGLGRHVPVDPGWLVGAVAGGVAVALLAELVPVLRLLRGERASIAAAGTPVPSTRRPLALRMGLDVVLLAASAVVLVLAGRDGYRVVVVPEGLPVTSVNYAALLAPALAWPGLALLVWRIGDAAAAARRSRPARDPAGRVPDLRAAATRRRRRVVARGATGLALAMGATVSTAVFTTTYDQQARLDVALTVGSDAAVTVPPDTAAPSLDPARAADAPGVRHVEPMLHRLTYVGPDLQDLYAVHADTIGSAAPLLDAFTPGRSVRSELARLGSTSDGALVSQETLHDYQLRPGDPIRLRLRDVSGNYRTVPFHVVGMVTEFATAPRDSFVVANYDYVAEQTGRSTPETLLVRTDRPAATGATLRERFDGPAVNVADTASETAAVTSASGLAATDLSGLTRLGIGFGVLLATANTVLALAIGAARRTRSMVALGILGASNRQRMALLWTEARALLLAGVLGGLVVGATTAYELVKVLTGVFDPPPEHIAVPWTGIALITAAVLGAAGVTGGLLARWAGRLQPSHLRDP